MSLDFITTDPDMLPPKLFVYGVEGIGKSTLGIKAPNSITVRSEATGDIVDPTTNELLSFAKTPVANTFGELFDFLVGLYENDHDYKTISLDSADWTEKLVWAEVVKDNPPAKAIDDDDVKALTYGKGYTLAMNYWNEYIDILDALNKEKGMAIIQLAHNQVKRYDDPRTEGYDRHGIKLHKTIDAKLREWSDAVLFADYKTAVRKEDVGFGQKKSKAIGSGERMLFTEERPAFKAKNRWNMPPEVKLGWDTVASHIPYYNQQVTTKQTKEEK